MPKLGRPRLPPAERKARRAATRQRYRDKVKADRRVARLIRQAEHPPTKLSKWELGQFVAIDGEGITRRGRHRYVLLCASTGEEASNIEGLSTDECLEFLVGLGEAYPRAVFAGFGIGYDVNMMLADLSRRLVRRVWAGKVVRWHGYGFQSRHRRSLRVWREPVKWTKTGETWTRDGLSMTWWDTWGFFQGSFAGALEKYFGPDYPTLKMIAEMKQQRRSFRAADLPRITRYCKAECAALVDLLTRLRVYLGDAGLSVSRWDGAGAVAAALLKREGVRQHLSRNAPLDTPPAVSLAAQHAYAGGRMEIVQYGHAPGTPIHHYDINSAYPSALREIPSLGLGRWVKVSAAELAEAARVGSSDFVVWRVRFQFRRGQRLYPFFWRTPYGAIFFPPRGEGWYWSPELSAATEALNSGALDGSLEVIEGWRWQCFESLRPFAWIDPLYRQRMEWKASGIGAEKILKLGLNSLYGKMAQHLGGSEERIPAYHQLEWAGWITSVTRAKLFRESVGRDGIIMLATDGVYSTSRLDVPTGSYLGEWDYKQHAGLTVVQSGLYWTDNPGGVTEIFCRGWDKGSLDRRKIVRAWGREAKSIEATLTRFIGMGSALAGDELWKQWRTWKTAPRRLALTMAGTKRIEAGRKNPATGLVRTVPTEHESVLFDPMSSPYPLPWETREWGQIDGAPESEVLREAGDLDI